jgi:L-2-hydroxyglutarate oxidase
VLLLEKESRLASHQTGHNSGVIHAGVYYTPGSLKARLCRLGNEETKRFCSEHDVPVKVCGKLIVATNDLEIARLGQLRERCRANEIAVDELDGGALSKLEPHIAGLAALRVPSTSIVDYRQVGEALAAETTASGGTIRFGGRVVGIIERTDEVEVELSNGESIRCAQLIVCAGLQSDRLARLAGLGVNFRVIPFRGEYFRLPDQKSNIVKHLIYPVPNPDLPFLGVHLTLMIGGFVTVGPNAVLAFARERYPRFSFNLRDSADSLLFPGFRRLLKKHWRSAFKELRGSLFKAAYLEECRKYCPELALEDLSPHPAGIRAQVVLADGTLVHDFMFSETKRMVHVLNAPSPAATASMPIARMIVERAFDEVEKGAAAQ